MQKVCNVDAMLHGASSFNSGGKSLENWNTNSNADYSNILIDSSGYFKLHSAFYSKQLYIHLKKKANTIK